MHQLSAALFNYSNPIVVFSCAVSYPTLKIQEYSKMIVALPLIPIHAAW